MSLFKSLTYGPLSLVIIIWAVFLVDILLPIDLRQFGIQPRNTFGLLGILFSPFLHANLFHILANTLPLFILSNFVLVQGKTLFYRVTTVIIILAGLGTWVFSMANLVIGASGLVFGYWSFLLANGWFNRSFKSVIIATITVILYGALFFSFLKIQPYISWAGHFWGAVAGLIAAYTENKWLGIFFRDSR